MTGILFINQGAPSEVTGREWVHGPECMGFCFYCSSGWEFKVQEDKTQAAQMLSYQNQPRALKQRSLTGRGGLTLHLAAGEVFTGDNHLWNECLFEVDAPATKALRPNLLGTPITKRKASRQGLHYTHLLLSLLAGAETLCAYWFRGMIQTSKREQRKSTYSLAPGFQKTNT